MIWNRRRARLSLLSLVVVACFPGCSDTEPLKPLPPEAFSNRPGFWRPILSPDGKWISYLALHNGAQNLHVAAVDGFPRGRAVTAVAGQGITASNVAGTTTYRWTADSKGLIYQQDESGDERWHLMYVDIASGEASDLTPLPGVQAELVAISKNRPREALVSVSGHNRDVPDLFRVDLDSLQRESVFQNPGYIGFFADNQLKPRVGVAAANDGGFDLIDISAPDSTDRLLVHYGLADTSALIRSVEQLAWRFNGDNSQLVLFDSRERDTWALTAIDLRSGKQTVLAADDRVDIDRPMFGADGSLELFRVNWQRPRWRAAQPESAAHLRILRSADDGVLDIINRSADGSRWLLAYRYSNRSPEYYLYHAKDVRLKHLATQMPEINRLDLPPLHPVLIKSRDGLDLVSYLLLPDQSDPDGDGRPAAPLPMIIYVHGGPNDERAEYAYSPRMQWLADRGYAVLNVNYRGSPGFGKNFLNAQNLEWGNKMNLDVVDQAHWAIEQGIADSERIGIMGGSYGGYEVLIAMSKTPGVFACGSALAPPTDMNAFIHIWWENFIPASNMAYKSAILGDPLTPVGRAALQHSSPLSFADKVRGPLLITQGDRDTRVPTTQVKRMVQALENHNRPVTFALFPDEGHGVVRPTNRQLFNAMQEAFFGRCLGGGYTPVAPELVDRANVILSGNLRLVPGLSDTRTEDRGDR